MMQQSKLVVTLGVVATALGALASWQAMGWPRPLVQSDLAPITRSVADVMSTAETALELARSNNRRILQNDWWRYDREIEDTEELMTERPTDRRLKETLRRLRREQSEIQRQIDKID